MRNSVLTISAVSSIVLMLSGIVNAGTLYATRNGTTLYEVDTSDAALTTVGSYADGSDGEAIAYHPPSGNLYRWTANITPLASTIDPSNSFAESFLSSGSGNEVLSATWNPSSNNFFMTTRNGRWRTMSAAGAFSGETVFPSGVLTRGVAFVGSTLYALEQGGTLDSDIVDLMTIDPSTGNVLSNVDIDIPGYTGNGALGLVYDPNTSTLYAALGTYSNNTGRFLATIDPVTGEGTVIGSFSQTGIASLALIPSVPEPTSLALLTSAAVIGLRRRK